MNDELTTLMTKLSEPAPPPSLKATVMARIAREADEGESASPAPALKKTYRDRLAWIAAFAGLAVVACAVAYGWLEAGSLPSMSPRVGLVSIPVIPQGPTALMIGLGLLVYLAGLFWPLRNDAPTKVMR